MGVCKNVEMNKVGTGKQSTYPRSCIRCGFGSCIDNVRRDPASTIDERFYHKVSEPVSDDKYAVIYTDTIYHEGDERSRTNPGHGYPAYSESVDKIMTFASKQHLLIWIEKNNSGFSRKTFKAIKYNELKVQTKVEITLD